jgi:hypothetical protein
VTGKVGTQIAGTSFAEVLPQVKAMAEDEATIAADELPRRGTSE